MNTFFANMYELFGQMEGFSDEMFENGLYLPTGICMMAIPMVLFAIYYYVLNSSGMNRWWHWLIIVIVIGVANLLIGYSVAYNGIWDIYDQRNVEPGYNIGIDSLVFGFINGFWSMVVAFVWSVMIKWGSSGCRRTPF